MRDAPCSLHWAFLDALSSDWRCAYPPTTDGRLIFEFSSQRPQMAIPPEVLSRRLDSVFSAPVDIGDDVVRACPVRVVSFNVNSLAKKGGVDRRQLLYEHLRMDRVHIACLQETRCTKSVSMLDGSFIRLSSAAEKGAYGCEVLMSCHLPFAFRGESPVYIGIDDVSVVYRTPRCLIALLGSRALRVAIVCAHAPHSKVAECRLFWTDVRRAVLSFVPIGFQILLCADVNGVIAPFASAAVGDTSASSVTTPLAVAFLDLCDELGLYLPVTYSANIAPCAELTTFVTSDGRHHTQQDFIATASSVHCIPASCDSWRHVDILHVRDDHFPVVCDMLFAVGGSCKPTARRRVRIRPQGLPWSEVDKVHVSQCLSSIPPVPWYVEPDSHLHIILQHLRHALSCLPSPPPIAKRRFISSVSLSMIRASRYALRFDHARRRRLRRSCLWAAFGAWSNKMWRCRWCSMRGFASKALCSSIVFSHFAARAAAAASAAYVRMDWCVYVSDMADRNASVLSGPCSSAMHSLIRNMRIRPASRPGRLSGSGGVPACSYHEERSVVRSHFASTLNGSTTSFHELLCTMRHRRMSAPLPVAHADSSLLPSVADVARQLRIASKTKAVGEDGIGGDIWATFADVLAPHLHSLFVKSLATVSTPLAWKGGMLMELWKGKGSASDLSSYRDILVQDHPAKIHGAILRPVLRSISECATRNTQWGSGLHSGSTEVAHLTIRAMMDVARLQRSSSAIVFLDVVSAFASFRRRIVLDCEASDEQWLLLLVSIGFDKAHERVIVSDACSLLIWRPAGASDHLVALLGEMYSETWLSTKRLDGVVSFDSGSMAGGCTG